MSQESRQEQTILDLQTAGIELIDLTEKMQRQVDAEPKLDAIAQEDIRTRAKTELHDKTVATFEEIRTNAVDNAWEKAGELSNTLYNSRKITPEIEAKQATLAILEDTLGQESDLYVEQAEELQQMMSQLQPSELEIELDASIEHYGQAVAIPSLAIRGISEAIKAPEISEVEEAAEVVVSDDQSEKTEDLQVVETESQGKDKDPKFRLNHKQGTMAQMIVDYVAAKKGTVTREDLMEYLDSQASDPTSYTSNRITRYGAYITQLERNADKLGIEVIRQGKRGEQFTLTIRELHPTPEVSARDIQEVYNHYATLRSERDQEVQGTISIVMLSEAILGMLKDPMAWSMGKEDPYWPNEADKILLSGFVNEAYEQLPQELSLYERRAYAASIILQKIHQDPHWLENEFNIYDKANVTGEYNPIQNALAIMLKLQDMTVAQRGNFITKQLNADPFVRTSAEVSKRVAVITGVSHLPLRHAAPDTATKVHEPIKPSKKAAAREKKPEVEVADAEQSTAEAIVATAVAAEVKVEPVADAKAVEKPKSIYVKKTAVERAEDKLNAEGIKTAIGEAIKRLDEVKLMEVNPDGKGLTIGTAQSMMRKKASNKFLTKEAVERLQAAGIVKDSDLNSADDKISRATMVLSYIFNSFQDRLSQKVYATAAMKIVEECIASFDKSRQTPSAK